MFSGTRILIVVLFESVNIWVTDKEKKKFFKPIRNRNEGEDGSNWSLNKLNIKKTGASGRGGAGGSVFIRILTFNRRKTCGWKSKNIRGSE